MKYRDMRGISVSEIGLGCSGFWGMPQFDERAAIKIVHEAFDLGVNFFDTGHNYCNYNAEPRLGRALREILKTTDRSKIVVSTKAGTLRRKPIFPSSARTQDHSPEYMERACAQAIKNLGCDHIDVFHLHNFPVDSITDDLLRKLDGMRQRGMFRLLGINTHHEAVMRHIADLNVFDVALIDLNVAQLDRLPVIDYLHKAGVAIAAGTVLAQGHLIAGKIGRINRASDLFYLARSILKADARRLSKAAANIRSALQGLEGLSSAQAAMAYILGLHRVTTCIFGTTKVENLKEICAVPHRPISVDEADAILSAFHRSGLSISA